MPRRLPEPEAPMGIVRPNGTCRIGVVFRPGRVPRALLPSGIGYPANKCQYDQQVGEASAKPEHGESSVIPRSSLDIN